MLISLMINRHKNRANNPSKSSSATPARICSGPIPVELTTSEVGETACCCCWVMIISSLSSFDLEPPMTFEVNEPVVMTVWNELTLLKRTNMSLPYVVFFLRMRHKIEMKWKHGTWLLTVSLFSNETADARSMTEPERQQARIQLMHNQLCIE